MQAPTGAALVVLMTKVGVSCGVSSFCSLPHFDTDPDRGNLVRSARRIMQFALARISAPFDASLRKWINSAASYQLDHALGV
jgi:hypothetical protein